MQIFYARSCPLPRWPSTPGNCHALPQPETRWPELIESLRQKSITFVFAPSMARLNPVVGPLIAPGP